MSIRDIRDIRGIQAIRGIHGIEGIRVIRCIRGIRRIRRIRGKVTAAKDKLSQNVKFKADANCLNISWHVIAK